MHTAAVDTNTTNDYLWIFEHVLVVESTDTIATEDRIRTAVNHLLSGKKFPAFQFDQITQRYFAHLVRIRGGVAEHVEEDGLGEGVELSEGGPALGL